MYVGIKKKESRQIKNKDTKMTSVVPKLRSSSLSIEYWIQHTTLWLRKDKHLIKTLDDGFPSIKYLSEYFQLLEM